MARLLIHVEGQTEEQFVNKILRKHLLHCGYRAVDARLLGNARQRRYRGGIRSWPSARREIVRHLQEDPACLASTMVDYYGLPREGADAWPDRLASQARSTSEERGACVERAMLADVAAAMGSDFDSRRFVPFVLMYEFEGLLFSDCAAFSRAIGHRAIEPQLRAIRNRFDTPEDINDSPQTAPSKRIQALVARYQKPLFGILAAREIGLAALRRQCPHFDGWMRQLESRAKYQPEYIP